MFQKILIANRGEIACRVIRTAKKLGIQTVAVYSDADANAQHVKLADEAVFIGQSPASLSYLQVDKIIAAALKTNAKAIHPGYGFLSENATFAKACQDNDIVFIGPPVEAILAMGLKATSKSLMEQAGVPLTPGYHGKNQESDFLKQQADRIGYPVLIKASAGGGGKGMSLVEDAKDFLASLASCKREALSSFGNDDVLVERYVTNPRHVEVQIFGDKFGNYVHMFERDCSVQRRHQKVIEEAPAPLLPKDKLLVMRDAAINAARAVNYEGAGTVEFIVEQDGTAYFMEMNTRLQVEHPVTEMITGLDLVEWQLRVAFGEPLPKTQDEIICQGHALEARIYAEIPEAGYMPATGVIRHLTYPKQNDCIRVDSGVVLGDEITTYYDPMIAKLIVWGQHRDEAIDRLRYALNQTHVDGLGNNIAFLARILQTDSFRQARLDTNLIGREENVLLNPSTAVDKKYQIMAAFINLLSQMSHHNGLWHTQPSWRQNTQAYQDVSLVSQGELYHVRFTKTADGWIARLNHTDDELIINGSIDGEGQATIHLDGIRTKVAFHRHPQGFALFNGSYSLSFEYPATYDSKNHDEDNGSLKAPMPGIITSVLVSAGQRVAKDDVLLTMEAMKIVYTIKAIQDGVVQACYFEVGEQVKAGDELVDFVADDQNNE
ncbi:acetyl/propionyl/methylcrotonyl-CoA carboxylase subunit alpha [Moraxella nasovis]|uniref:acetyl/propionyl/methylcrotonyl-CoA carboxylase subunit alpha n=1 Tax=Moraxella nasovis TaxID=2904121 RepID=UPI001F611B67|nr:acetyl/propionyl/methylcrotonyl-CoA carboxylase subunit alpha [Moraxella nasovis]UNU74037.1 acetyl/propionyl/methylcrotonyl-CoA carboxylase subunit alpha [Moraxella nasovis]